MPDYRAEDGQTVHVERKSGVGGIVLALIVLAAVVVGLLFATGFFSARVNDSGSLPQKRHLASTAVSPTPRDRVRSSFPMNRTSSQVGRMIASSSLVTPYESCGPNS